MIYPLEYMKFENQPLFHQVSNEWYKNALRHTQSPKLGEWGEIASFNSHEIDTQKDSYWHAGQIFLSKLKFVDENIFGNIQSENLLSFGLLSIWTFIEIGLSNLYFEFSFEKSILLIANYGDYKIYLEIFFSEDPQYSNQIEDSVLNVYKNQESVFCQAGEIFKVFKDTETFIKGIKREHGGNASINELGFIPTVFDSENSLQNYQVQI